MKLSHIKCADHISNLLDSVGTEYFDLVLYHHPFAHFESRTQLESSWRLLVEHLDSKNVRKIGVSNFYSNHLVRLLDICTENSLEKPFANEIQLNPYVFWSERDLIDLCKGSNIVLIAYCPLGFYYSRVVLRDKNLIEFGKALGATPAQVSLAWLMSKSICVIPKSEAFSHQDENFKSSSFINDVASMSEDLNVLSSQVDETNFLIDTSFLSKEHARELTW
jgi:diketogulonate reductase-like aldo/keto reductase